MLLEDDAGRHGRRHEIRDKITPVRERKFSGEAIAKFLFEVNKSMLKKS